MTSTIKSLTIQVRTLALQNFIVELLPLFSFSYLSPSFPNSSELRSLASTNPGWEKNFTTLANRQSKTERASRVGGVGGRIGRGKTTGKLNGSTTGAERDQNNLCLVLFWCIHPFLGAEMEMCLGSSKTEVSCKAEMIPL